MRSDEKRRFRKEDQTVDRCSVQASMARVAAPGLIGRILESAVAIGMTWCILGWPDPVDNGSADGQ
jgi:hypothetical protein